MNLKTFNESFRKYYTEDIDEVVTESFESDLRNSLERVSEKLARQLPRMDVDAYTRAFERCIEEMVPDTSWWEVTDCDIFNNLFNTHDIMGTIDCIIDNLKPEYKDLQESIEFDETKTYVDTDGGFGKRGEKFTGKELKKYYDENHSSDPVLSGYASFEDWFKDTSTNYLKEVEDEGCTRRLKEYYDEAEVIGKGYSAPVSIDYATEVKYKLKYNALEDLESIQEYMNQTISKVEEFDEYWNAHKSAIMKNIKEAQDLIPVEYRR